MAPALAKGPGCRMPHRGITGLVRLALSAPVGLAGPNSGRALLKRFIDAPDGSTPCQQRPGSMMAARWLNSHWAAAIEGTLAQRQQRSVRTVKTTETGTVGADNASTMPASIGRLAGWPTIGAPTVSFAWQNREEREGDGELNDGDRSRLDPARNVLPSSVLMSFHPEAPPAGPERCAYAPGGWTVVAVPAASRSVSRSSDRHY